MSSGFTFRADARWEPGRRGAVTGDAAAGAIEFSAPPEFHGQGGVWSPEHFLLAAVASCFVTTFLAIAQLSKFDAESLQVFAEGTVEKGDGGYAFTGVSLKPRLTIHEEADRDRALRLLQKTERSCLISRSLKAAVRLEPEVTVSLAEMADVT